MKSIIDVLNSFKFKASYLIVSKKRENVGSICESDVFKLVEHEIIPISSSNLNLSESQSRDDEAYITLLDNVLHSGFFYFSYNYDLTSNLEHQITVKPSILQRSSSNESRFLWNSYILQPLISAAESQNFVESLTLFALPLIFGCNLTNTNLTSFLKRILVIEIKRVNLDNKFITLAIISRRCKFRAGTRCIYPNFSILISNQ
jgi:phosphatidylinositol 4-phosphatase